MHIILVKQACQWLYLSKLCHGGTWKSPWYSHWQWSHRLSLDEFGWYLLITEFKLIPFSIRMMTTGFWSSGFRFLRNWWLTTIFDLATSEVYCPPLLFFWHICAREYSLIFSYNVLKGVRCLDAATFAQGNVGNWFLIPLVKNDSFYNLNSQR